MIISAGDILKNSWALYAKNWKKMTVFMTMLFLPTLVLSILGVISLYMSQFLPSSTLSTSLIIFIVGAVSLVFTLWTVIAFAKVLMDIMQNREPGEWKTYYAATSGAILPLIATSLLVSLIVIGGTLLFIIPGIIFSVWYSFSFYEVVFEGKVWTKALSASKSLVVGRWWQILWRILVPGIVFGFVSGLLSSLFTYLIQIIPMTPLADAVVERIVSSILNIIVTPLTAAATLILYVSVKENPVTSIVPPVPPVAEIPKQ